jgi:hypothetical protein
MTQRMASVSTKNGATKVALWFAGAGTPPRGGLIE